MADERAPCRPRQSTVALVHGGFLGAWIWVDAVAGLDAEGISAVTVDLPSVAADADQALLQPRRSLILAGAGCRAE